MFFRVSDATSHNFLKSDSKANKLGSHCVSLHQKQMQLLGDASTLAMCNTLTFLGSPTNRFFGLQQKETDFMLFLAGYSLLRRVSCWMMFTVIQKQRIAAAIKVNVTTIRKTSPTTTGSSCLGEATRVTRWQRQQSEPLVKNADQKRCVSVETHLLIPRPPDWIEPFMRDRWRTN